MQNRKNRKVVKEKPATDADNIKDIRDLHKANEQYVVDRLRRLTQAELIRDYLVEMRAKNQAYYFILEKGLLERFRDYIKNTPG